MEIYNHNPKEGTMRIYKKNGYENRKDYLNQLAENYKIDTKTVCVFAWMLGPDEDFDYLIIALQKYSEDY